MPREVTDLPKAHLHLHFTGSMRVETVRDLARGHGISLPDALTTNWPPQLARATDERGWFRFQRLYDAARACVRGESDMRRIVREAAHDDDREGSRWLELQVDPTSYAPFVGGITPALEIVLDEARVVSKSGRTAVAVVVAASRMRHPFEARTLARLAGLTLVPHAGELLGSQAVMETLEHLRPDRIGHAVRSVEDPRVLSAVAESGATLEVCPGSNVALGVYASPAEVPLRTIVESGIPVALGADDPLLFGQRLCDQYEARLLGFDDGELADLARQSLKASRAPEPVRQAALADVDAWLEAPARPDEGSGRGPRVC